MVCVPDNLKFNTRHTLLSISTFTINFIYVTELTTKPYEFYTDEKLAQKIAEELNTGSIFVFKHPEQAQKQQQTNDIHSFDTWWKSSLKSITDLK